MKQASDLRIPFSWAERRPIVLERFFYLPPCDESLHNSAIFTSEVTQKLAVEYCSGNGQWITQAAIKQPEFLWVAVEKCFERARKIWLNIFRHQLSNLFVVCGDALTFSRFYLQPQSVEAAFINFPDPWPKRRHARHRIIQPEFVAELGRILVPAGAVTLVTDDAPTSERMITAFSSWKSLFDPPHFVTEWPDYGSSYFYSLWVGKMRTIRYHRFVHG